MQQQPLLTSDEVIELLKDALPDDETMRNALERNIDLCRAYAIATAL